MGAAARSAIQIPAARKVLSLSAHPHLAEGFPGNRVSLRFSAEGAFFVTLAYVNKILHFFQKSA